MTRHCAICKHELEPSDKRCRRCGAEVGSRDNFWLMILIGICVIGLITFAVYRIINR
jgi:predicted amidophosphoribosyltransferase